MGEAFEVEEDAFQEHHHEHTHTYYDRTGSDSIGDNADDRYMLGINIDIPRNTNNANHGRIVAADKTSSARIATETRPKNIKVVYLIKCWHLGQE